MSAQISFVGNATRDADLNYTNSGQPVAKFGVAVSKRQKDDAGNWIDGPPTFFDVSCWRKLAENCAESIHKGTRVMVSGRIEQRTYKANDGSERTVYDVTADDVGISLFFDPATTSKAVRQAAEGNGGLFD